LQQSPHLQSAQSQAPSLQASQQPQPSQLAQQSSFLQQQFSHLQSSHLQTPSSQQSQAQHACFAGQSPFFSTGQHPFSVEQQGFFSGQLSLFAGVPSSFEQQVLLEPLLTAKATDSERMTNAAKPIRNLWFFVIINSP